MTSFFRDLAFAGRLLVKRPGFTLLILLVLVPGFAVNLAVFSFVKAVIFEALPFPHAERLTTIIGTVQRETTELRGLSYPDYLDLVEQTRSLEAFAAATSFSMNLTGEAVAQRVMVEFVTPEYFDALGVDAGRGRLFTEEENRLPVGEMVAVISDELWRNRYGGDPDLIGRPIRLDGREVMVIGVTREGFRGFEDDVELWVPLTSVSGLRRRPSAEFFTQRGVRFLRGFARLREGMSLSEAQEEMTTIARRLEDAYPDTNENRSAALESLDEHVLGELRPTLRMLWMIAGLVLLVVVANALNLLVVRLVDRRKEISLRAALGAGPGRIGRQLLAENLLLGLLAGGLGTLLGAFLVRLGARLNPIPLPGYTSPRLDLGVLGFALLLALLVGILLAILPVMQARRLDLNRVLRDATGGVTDGSRRSFFDPRRWLFVGEVALAVVVLVGASLIYQSFENQRAIDPGFDSENLVSLRLDLPSERYRGDAGIAFARRLGEEAEALPGVRSVGLSSDLPMAGGYRAIVVQVEDRLADDPEHRIRVYLHSVTPGFFETLGIPLLRGGIFESIDSEEEEALQVLVSQRLAEVGWPDSDPVGALLRLGRTSLSVVGVVGDVRYRHLVPDDEGGVDDPDIYLPLFERAPSSLALVARTETNAQTLVASVRDLVNRLEPDAPLYGVETMDQLLEEQTRVARVASLLFGLLGGLALIFATSGLYAVISYSVSQRTTEIGLRKALGSSRRGILARIVGEGLRLFAVGLVLGLALALGFHRVLASLLFGISPTDAGTYVWVAVFLLAVAAVSCLVPAFRAARLDPAVALKTG
ncbi:MAG: ADOP family duplicated permease [Acidobacteriota bacterium]